MIIFGVNAVTEAVQSNKPNLQRITITRGKSNPRLQRIIDLAREQGIPVLFEPLAALDSKAQKGRHQDVVAETAEIRLYSLDDIIESNPNLVVVVDGVEDPRNLGAVLRTAEAAGVQAVLLPQRHSCGITPTVVQASAGAALHLKVARIGNVVQALEKLKEAGLWVVGLDMEGPNRLEEIRADTRLVVVIGGEHRGVRRLVREHCDFLLALPMRGKVPSLNLSVAAGILLYQLTGQRSGERK